MNKPVISGDYFIYKDMRYDVEFYEITDGKIPDLDWCQVYAVGNLDGKVPIVKYPHAKDNLPGGGVRDGEDVEQALKREVKEELNMQVKSWYPIGYQRNIDQNGDSYYQLRVYAELEKIGEFVRDPDGSVAGYDLIEINNLNSHIKWGGIGGWLIERVKTNYGQL